MLRQAQHESLANAPSDLNDHRVALFYKVKTTYNEDRASLLCIYQTVVTKAITPVLQVTSKEDYRSMRLASM